MTMPDSAPDVGVRREPREAMLSLRTGTDRGAERRGPVNAYAIFVVNEHLRVPARRGRQPTAAVDSREAQPPRADRLGGRWPPHAASSSADRIRGTWSSPKLEDYPYRG